MKLAILAGLSWALIACSVEGDGGDGRPSTPAGSGGSSGAPSSPGDTGSTLTVEGDSIVRLGYGETTELAVQLLSSDDEPERNREVQFNLVGRPEDSSLATRTARTDNTGHARVTLRGASRPVTFQVRASSGRARLPALFNISVGGDGFGSVIVTAPYEGARAVEQRVVLALPRVSCSAADDIADDRKTVLAPGEDTAALIALPAGVSYAVIALAQSASGETLARGCVDEVPVSQQGEEEVTIPFVDLPLTPERRSSLVVTLEAGSAAAAVAAAIRGAVSTLVRSSTTAQSAPRDADGDFWLDSLEASLREDAGDAPAIALADALASARLEPAGPAPESELATLLSLNDERASKAASAIAAEVRESLDTIVLRGDLELESGDALSLSIDTMQIEALPVLEGARAPSVALTDAPASLAATLVPNEDVLELTELSFAPRLGALGAAALERVLAAERDELGVDLIALAGCGSLQEWLPEQSHVDAGACDRACIARACRHGFDRIAEAAREALDAIDVARPTATLSGSLWLTDGDGDLRAERMEAERIDGEWAPAPEASLGDTLVGTAVASAAGGAP